MSRTTAAATLRLYKGCKGRAKAIMGPGWLTIGDTLREALVAREIVALIEGQDESLGGEAKARLLHSLNVLMLDDIEP